jgi:hypothetical protein
MSKYYIENLYSNQDAGINSHSEVDIFFSPLEWMVHIGLTIAEMHLNPDRVYHMIMRDLCQLIKLN